MKAHETNAFAVARYLETSPYVEEVMYPGEDKWISKQNNYVIRVYTVT